MKEAAHAVTKLSELGELWKQYDVIGIDEGQFYTDVSLKVSCHMPSYAALNEKLQDQRER